MMSDKVSLEDLVGKLKRESSGWIRTKGEGFGEFNWQNGYGAFSVSAAEIELLKHYIQHQHRHHSNLLFEDEYKRMLNEYALEYDEKYLWD
jgi:REP element-mobilizing transposase RayT